MSRVAHSQTVSRRRLIGLALGLGAVGPILQACAQAAPTATPAPAKPAAPAAAPAKAAPTPEVKVVTKEVEKVVTKEVQVAVTATPRSTAKITGNLQIIQRRSFNPIQTQFQHNLLIKEAAARNWPLDKTYIEGFSAGTNIYEKLQAQSAAGDAPDMIVGGIDPFQGWYLGLLEPVDDILQVAQKQFGKASPSAELNHKIDGKWYSVPYCHYTGGWWVQKSWFDEAGIDVFKKYNFDEWRQHALAISDPDKKRWGWGITVNRSGDGNTNVRHPVYKAGGRVTTADNKVAFNSPETIAGYTWLKETYSDPKWEKMMPPGVNAWTDLSNNEAWAAGTIGFSSNAGTMVATTASKAPDVYKNTAVVPEPVGSVGKKEALVMNSPDPQTLQLFKGGKNRDAAREMIEILLSKENQDATIKTNPALVLPAFENHGWDHPTLKDPPNRIMEIQKELVYAQGIFFRFMPGERPRLWINATNEENVETDVMADILKGVSVEEAVANGHKRMEAIHKKFEGK